MTHVFPVGRAFAESLGYRQELLASLPNVSIEAFAGVSNLSLFSNIPEGAAVLDLGCGAGFDSLVASRRVGPTGRVVGVDFSFPMLTRARRGAIEAAIENVVFCQTNAEELPLKDSSVEIALVNGIFNLNPARDDIFRELARVVQPNGSVYVAELILSKPAHPEVRASESAWFA
jgi:arsenite methyltransferase